MIFNFVSDNCWAGAVCKYLKIEYNTPFVNTYIHTPDYIKLLENFDYYLLQELKFPKCENSKYNNIDTCNCIIGILNDIEIRFPHYKNKQEILECWNRRKKRLSNNKDDILFKLENIYSHGFHKYDNFNELIKRFYNLPYKNKVSFTLEKHDYPNNFKILPEHLFRCDLEGQEVDKYFDIKHWINTREIIPTK